MKIDTEARIRELEAEHGSDGNERSLGQVGYDAYGKTADWKTFDGRPMPTWEQLGATEAGRETRRRWEVAANAVLLTAQALLVAHDVGPGEIDEEVPHG